MEAAIEEAELDPAAARVALTALRGDHLTLRRIESWLGGDANRTAFGLGAAITIANAELATVEPDLRALMPQLQGWLEGSW